MKKMFLMAAILCSMVTMAQQAVITFNKTTHDFGKINEADGRVTTIFECKNEGMSPLVLTNVKASCGCTTPNWTKEPIAPGKTGNITVTYNPSGRPGRFQKSITVTSNGSTEPVRLYIKGEVIPKPAQPVDKYPIKVGELSLQRNNINLGSITKGLPKTVEIEYANTTSAAITVDIKFETSKTYWKPFISMTKLEPGQTGKLQMTLQTDECPLYGPVDTKIQFIVNGKTYTATSQTITYKADIKEDFSKMTPEDIQQAPIIEYTATLDAGVVKVGKKTTSKLTLHNAGLNPLHIRRVYSNDGNINIVPPKSIKGGKSEVLPVTINAANATAGQYTREITIITNDPKKPIAKVKVVWTVE